MSSAFSILVLSDSGDELAEGAAHAVDRFDSVLCFGGEDWWYHNRGHYDMQMMREFSGRVRVLYVNSIGMRVHRVSEGAMFVRRVARKLRSMRRGLVRVAEGFAVYSPLVAPGPVGRRFARWTLPAQVGWATRRLRMTRPLLWVACPPAARFLDDLPAAGMVYQRTDRFEAFGGVDPAVISGYDRLLKSRADVTLFCSRALFDAERHQCRNAVYVDHGVDYEHFAAAGDEVSSHPADVRCIARPRVGFIGGIDAHTFDPELFVDVARRMHQVQFVLVGACSLPAGWCDLPNVTLLGQRPYAQVAGYMAACDVLIMPWNRSDWIKACNPVKLKEYLAVGRPIVSTPFAELERYSGLVEVAGSASEFAEAIGRALQRHHDPTMGRERVRRQTWAWKAGAVLGELENLGLRIARERVASAAVAGQEVGE
jgi:glycosyltransferase involved in cell wall biosynthesis